uniref:ATP-dependent DNA helicase n=1 Tax=Chenopodium quinoa TaxID=63459 RepID=A0A803MUL7_CHEQI
MLRNLKDNKKFGKVIANFYVIEFQNRRLPHAHILITLAPEDKPKCPDDIDVIISAEIPDKDTDPLAFETITKNMLHGPCGPCLIDGKCSKHFPKKFCAETTFHDNGFVQYRRRQNREPIIVNGRAVDNRWVVPYNRDLCVKYNAHNNVERVSAKVCGEESFEDIQTIDGVIHPTFRSACHALGLLDDDNEWHETLSEASNWALDSQLRNMFCSILMFSEVSDPKQLWEQHWGELTDDLERMMRRQTRNPKLRLTPEEMQNQGLQEIEHILNKLGRSLTDFPDMPQPSSELARNALNRLIRDELEYDTHDEANRFDTLVRGLNTDQYRVYAAILDAHSRDVGGLFFVYNSGGTGKTYLWNTLIAKFRSKRKIVLSMASSGIAALLLSGGKTAHLTFKIPFDLDQHSICNFKKDSTRADLSDICNDNRVFGGKLVVLGGDFRQILPVVPDEGRESIVAATLHRASFWRDCQVMCLRINMRLCRSDVPSDTLEQIREFADWIIKVGEGVIAGVSITEEGNVQRYYSSDTLGHTEDGGILDNMEPMELLNSLNLSGLPNHCLELKVGAPEMNTRYTPCRCVTLTTLNVNMRVRLLWMVTEQSRAKGTNYVHRSWSMVFTDSEGNEVQITLFNADIDKYKENLKRGKVYSIAQLELMPLDTSYKYATNQMRLKFGNKTMITEILDDCDDIPRYNFRFIEFCNIPQYLHMRNSPLIDVIGLVIYVSESYRVSGGRQQFKRDVLLCNTNMETMRLTLWEVFAHDQGRFLFYELNQDHVLGASMVSVGSYYGACLSTVGRTRLFIDPDINETDDLHG